MTKDSKVVATPVFSVSFVYPDKTFTAKGKEIMECFEELVPKLSVDKRLMMAKTVIKLTEGKRSAEKFFYPNYIKRFTVNRTFRQMLAKNLYLSLK